MKLQDFTINIYVAWYHSHRAALIGAFLRDIAVYFLTFSFLYQNKNLLRADISKWFNPLKSESFAVGVRRLLEDPALSARLAMAAKLEALARFHPEVIARRHLEIYPEVLAAER